MPKVSVLIPSIRPQYLSQTIASVLAQTFDDFECLVADNTAAGSLHALVSRFTDPRVRYLRTGGLSQGENLSALWAATSAPFVKYLFDDDFMLPFCLGRMVWVLEQRPDASFAFVQRHVVSAAGDILFSPSTVKADHLLQFSAVVMLPQLLTKCVNMVGEPSSVLINRRLFDGPACLTEYRGFRLRFLLDVGFFMNALMVGPCMGIGEFHAAFRQHGEQLSAAGVSPTLLAGLYEWEIFLRGEFSAGRLQPDPFLEGVAATEAVYRRRLPDFPELQVFLDGLAELPARIGAGDRDLLDPAFRAVWLQADAAIERQLGERRAGGAAAF